MRAVTRPVSGPELFVRYAYPPNALGYCGPGDSAALFGLATDEADHDRDLRHLASEFDGAWPYLQLLAATNNIADPLDRRVVKAYWVGSPLLTSVPGELLWRSLEERFHARAGRRFELLATAAALGGVPHHSFHVLAISPWIGMLRAGMDEPAITVLDRCRIRTGVVEAVEGDLALVRSRRLEFHGSQLLVGGEVVEKARLGFEGIGFVGDLRRGESVSLHWDWICDRLSAYEAWSIEHWTARNLAAVNASPRPF